MEAGKSAKEPATKGSKKAQDKQDDRRRTLRWGVVGLALLVGLIAWVATRGDDDSGEPESASAGFEARIVNEEELADIAASSGHAVYWVGPLPGKELEASESEDGSIEVRYLDEGAEVGSDRTGVLTIGSYPLPDATGALDGFAEREGAIVREADDGGKVVSSIEAPSSVYFVSADGSVQVEVYEPSPERAMKLALSGQVQPVD